MRKEIVFSPHVVEDNCALAHAKTPKVVALTGGQTVCDAGGQQGPRTVKKMGSAIVADNLRV